MAKQSNPPVSDQPLPEELRQPLRDHAHYHLQSPGLPLAVYREVEAHLRQVQGVEAGLLPQTSQTFEYSDSQAGGVWIRYTRLLNESEAQQLEAVLAYYAGRYRPWQVILPSRDRKSLGSDE